MAGEEGVDSESPDGTQGRHGHGAQACARWADGRRLAGLSELLWLVEGPYAKTPIWKWCRWAQGHRPLCLGSDSKTLEYSSPVPLGVTSAGMGKLRAVASERRPLTQSRG